MTRLSDAQLLALAVQCLEHARASTAIRDCQCHACKGFMEQSGELLEDIKNRPAQETRVHPFFVEEGEPAKGPLPSADLLTPRDCDCTGKTGCVGSQEGRTCLLSCLGLNRGVNDGR
jgi:hypothetical protein